jgi:hypothetical protein
MFRHSTISILLKIFVVLCAVNVAVFFWTILGVKNQASLHLTRTILSAMKVSRRNVFCPTLLAEDSRFSRLRSNRILFALNLHNNQEIMTDLIVQLGQVMGFLGHEQVYVSIFESGSTDQTRVYLSLFKSMLDKMNVKSIIEWTEDTLTNTVHRIEYLAEARNRVLRQASGFKVDFDRVVFMNDVYFCATDILELLLQAEKNKADLTCGLDFDTDGDGEGYKTGLGFYDTWVARDINGRIFHKRPLNELTSDPESNERIKQNEPFQVGCCWNGLAVINGNALKTVSFRRSLSKQLNTYHEAYASIREKYPTRKVYKECAGSEMTSFCKDLTRSGFDKFIVVPKVKFAYNIQTYESVNTKKVHGNDTLVQFKPMPLSMECQNIEKIGARNPSKEIVEELWNINVNNNQLGLEMN